MRGFPTRRLLRVKSTVVTVVRRAVAAAPHVAELAREASASACSGANDVIDATTSPRPQRWHFSSAVRPCASRSCGGSESGRAAAARRTESFTPAVRDKNTSRSRAGRGTRQTNKQQHQKGDAVRTETRRTECDKQQRRLTCRSAPPLNSTRAAPMRFHQRAVKSAVQPFASRALSKLLNLRPQTKRHHTGKHTLTDCQDA